MRFCTCVQARSQRPISGQTHAPTTPHHTDTVRSRAPLCARTRAEQAAADDQAGDKKRLYSRAFSSKVRRMQRPPC